MFGGFWLGQIAPGQSLSTLPWYSGIVAAAAWVRIVGR